jgi:PhoPQ-activated pathogenicity-related protein
MTLTSLRKLAKSRGFHDVYLQRTWPDEYEWIAAAQVKVLPAKNCPVARHPSRDVAIRMLAMGLRAMPRGKR